MKYWKSFGSILIFLISFKSEVLAFKKAAHPTITVSNEEAFSPAEINPPVITYATIPTPTCISANMTLTGVNITDATGIPLTGLNRPRIYYRRNAGAWFSNAGINTGGTTTNSTWTFSITETDMGGVTGGDIISYYIIAQDLTVPANVGSNPAAGLVASGVNNVTSPPTSPNTYILKYNLNGVYTVGSAGNFATLTAAVNAYNNACSLAGNIIFELTDNNYAAETFPIVISLHPDASAAHTLTIRPSATALPVITAAVSTPVFNFNGARFVRFEGRQNGVGSGRSLTVSNTGTGIALQFINDAQNNIISYCVVKAQRISGFSGTIVFGTAAAAGTGNDNNVIDNNEISESAGGFSNNGIYSSGTAGKENDNNSVTNNTIANFYSPTSNSHGIFVAVNNSSWTISGNRLFQTATRLYTVALTHFGIYVTDGAGYTIKDNIVGFADASGNGTTNMIGNSAVLAGFPGAYTATGTAVDLRYIAIGCALKLTGPPSTVDGNSIGGFAMYTASNFSSSNGMFCGIYIESGIVNIGTTSGNIIGAQSGSNSIYVATTGVGAVIGIKAVCISAASIQNNIIGSITASGVTGGTCPTFTGINAGGLCNYTITNNFIGNTDADNIRVGYAFSAGVLSNTGTLSSVNSSVATSLKGIACTGTGNALSITNNSFSGWLTSCSLAANTGVESSGAMTGAGASVNINRNAFGTTAVNWLNATLDNAAFVYCINVSNTSALSYSISNNNVRGAFFGARKCTGGTLFRLSGATSPGAVATISSNIFSNLSFKFSTGNIYLIVTAYSISSTGKLIIDNNKIAGSFSATGPATYHLITSIMSSASGAQVSITGNDFSNLNVGAGAASNLYGIYSSFNLNACSLTLSDNKLSNWTFGNGSMTGLDISDMKGTVSCDNNTISNIACQGIIEAIYLNTTANSGIYNVTNNKISGLISSGSGGYINGASVEIPSGSNTTQTNFSNNIISGLSSSDADGVVTGFYLFSGHSSSNVTINKNKIYNLSESTNGGYVYGIYNDPTLAGDITYSNNYIGDLRAPLSNVSDPSIAGIYLFMSAGQAKVYYNTIHLNASGIASQFSTAAVYADAATAITLRNNIFSNSSIHGATGKTVAYWRGDSNTSAYAASSNNNVFYAGAASTRNLIFYDGTNSDQSLAFYQARVFPKDNFSLNVLPDFSSTIGANPGFLHLASSGNCGIASGGNNSGILLGTDYDGDMRNTTTPFLSDIGADEITKLNMWTGAVDNKWSNANNWSALIVPDDYKTNVFISPVPAAQPLIDSGEVFQVGNIIINNGALLSNRGILKITDSIYAGAGSINNMASGLVKGSIELNGSCSKQQQLEGNVFVNNNVKDLKISNNAGISSLPGKQLNISGALLFGSTGKTFFTNDNVVLLSSARSTANVGDVTGNLISGKVTVERFINTGLVVDGRHLKSWQFLATPAVGQSIFQSWQEAGIATPGYGTIITGTGSGFDIVTAAPSIKLYSSSGNTWSGVTNTGNPVNDKRGYMLFVRGDRTVTAYNQDAVPTILRTKGELYQPSFPPPAITVMAGKMESAGNPYASAISIAYMRDNGMFTNLDNDVVVWDALLAGNYSLGGYQTLSAANNYEPTAGGSPPAFYPAGISSPLIQSGQAFFVHSSGLSGSVSFSEACKSGSNRLVNRYHPPGKRQYFRASVYTSNGNIADGNAVVFDDNFKNTVDADDSRKVINAGENFALIRNNQTLAVEARMKVKVADTIFYNLSNFKKQSYQLRFAPTNMQTVALRAFLVDKYLNSFTSLSFTDSSFVNIEINNDPGSSATDRFYVIFRAKGNHPDQAVIAATGRNPVAVKSNEIISSEAISVYPNPVSNKVIYLHFKQPADCRYEIRIINALGQTVLTKAITTELSDKTQLIRLDPQILSGNYLISIKADSGSYAVLPVFVK